MSHTTIVPLSVSRDRVACIGRNNVSRYEVASSRPLPYRHNYLPFGLVL